MKSIQRLGIVAVLALALIGSMAYLYNRHIQKQELFAEH